MDAVPLGRGLGQPPIRWTHLSSTSASTSRARPSPRRPHPRPRPTGRAATHRRQPPRWSGFAALAAWLTDHGAGSDDVLVCLEFMGVIGEALCYWLYERSFRVVVEDAAKVRRAMPVSGAKTDALDAQRIADYAVVSSTSSGGGRPPRPSWSR